MEYTAFVVDLVVCEAREQERKEEKEEQERKEQKKRTIRLDRERLLAVFEVMKLIRRQDKRFVL